MEFIGWNQTLMLFISLLDYETHIYDTSNDEFTHYAHRITVCVCLWPTDGRASQLKWIIKHTKLYLFENVKMAIEYKVCPLWKS